MAACFCAYNSGSSYASVQALSQPRILDSSSNSAHANMRELRDTYTSSRPQTSISAELQPILIWKSSETHRHMYHKGLRDMPIYDMFSVPYFNQIIKAAARGEYFNHV